MGVWAEENSRNSLFDAMVRREVFGTSGTRIRPRFFGGWDFDPSLCEGVDLVKTGYERGVPMGADLPPRPGDAAPVFAVSALRDPGTVGLRSPLLQRLQIIKGWSDDDGQFHQRIIDVAGSADNGAGVDLDSCIPHGTGETAPCAVWRDPDFDPERRSVYYARVVENPTCRWNAHQCAALPPTERPASCSDPAVPKVIQERAWTSPIWYEPGATARSQETS